MTDAVAVLLEHDGIVIVSTGAVAAAEHLGLDTVAVHDFTGFQNDGVGNGQRCDGGGGAGLGAIFTDLNGRYYCEGKYACGRTGS